MANSVFHTENIDFFMDVFNPNGDRRERLSFFNVSPTIGVMKLHKTFNTELNLLTGSVYNTLCCDGDVIEDRFIVLEDSDSYIEFTEVNFETHEVKGKFQITFVRDPNDKVTNPSLPDTIQFTEGSFHSKIREVEK